MTRVVDPDGTHLEVLRGLADFSGARVLEIGAGDGRLTMGFAPDAASVLAIDPDEDSIAEAERSLAADLRERVSFRVASAADVDIPRTAFDIVLFSWSL
jgi:2-polyprenyl-3-methyl-5-hydroxy-6-metoxy-1,4-benzoquinol methylase